MITHNHLQSLTYSQRLAYTLHNITFYVKRTAIIIILVMYDHLRPQDNDRTTASTPHQFLTHDEEERLLHSQFHADTRSQLIGYGMQEHCGCGRMEADTR